MNWYILAKKELSDKEFNETYEPQWEKVDSSLIDSFMYYENAQLLDIKLKGQIYTYLNVPKNIINDFRRSKSKGKFFNKEIRNFYKRIK